MAMMVPDWADGFTYVDDWLTAAEAAELARTAKHLIENAGPLLQSDRITNNGRSRVVRMGYDLSHAHEVAPMPAWALALRYRLAREIVSGAERCNSLTVNEYQPGDSIHAHTDCYGYGEPIVSVSVGAVARFVLRRPGELLRVEAAIGSVIVLERGAAKECQHEIEAWGAQPGTRYSVVLRVRERTG